MCRVRDVRGVLDMGEEEEGEEPEGMEKDDEDELEEEANADLSLSIIAKHTSRCAPASPSPPSGCGVVGGDAQVGHDSGLPVLWNGEVTEKSASEEGQIVSDEAAVSLPSTDLRVSTKKKKKRKKKAVVDVNSMQNDLVVESLETVLIEEAADGRKAENVKTPSQATAPFEPFSAQAASSIAMRKLLRGPRYFDPPEDQQKTCYNCNSAGHLAIDCPEEPRSKPCYVCGKFNHEGRECPQGLECYICGDSGHFAKTCPQKGKVAVDQLEEVICLHCGEIGHDAAVCWKDYSVEDLKAIRCYVCKHYGHLCCVDVVAVSHTEVSCYNCGEMGHTGVGCAKSRGLSKNSEKPAQICYKCGEEGHFARGCSKRDQGFDDNSFVRDAHEPHNWTQTPSGLLNMGTTPKELVHLNQNDSLEEQFASAGGAQTRQKGWRCNGQDDFVRRNWWQYENQPYQVRRWYGETPQEKSISLPRWYTLTNSSHENSGYANARYSNETFRTPSHKRWRT